MKIHDALERGPFDAGCLIAEATEAEIDRHIVPFTSDEELESEVQP